jgi:environmental stress-induced protein Ves
MLRLAVAEIGQGGPFSTYSGVQRWFAVLSGNGVRLRIGDSLYVLNRESAPLRFNGGTAPDCELLDGPTQDFNLMLREGCARVKRVNGLHHATCGAGNLVAIYANEYAVTINGSALAIAPHTLIWRVMNSQDRIKLVARDALWMEVSLTDAIS